VRLIFNLLFVGIVAAALGLALTWLAVQRPPAIDAIRSGPWMALASEGTSDVDAYALATISRRGEVPLAVGDGLAFRAVADDQGRPLTGRCTYTISGTIPTVRAWSLAAYDAAGAAIPNAADRHAFSSGDIMREADGRVVITLGSSVQPGSWLPIAAGQPFVLVLRLYDTTIGAISGGRSAPELPALLRNGCSS
jgi:hypothetical protein